MDEDGSARPQTAVTADDVARRAGVSRWTVNRAFKKDASISARSREKVLSAAAELGYVPDLLAASLASSRSRLVALLIDDFANPHKLVMLERLTRILQHAGWDTLLVNMLSEDDGRDALMNASQRRVDAAILIGIQFDDKVLAAALGARRVRKLIIFARSSQNAETISIAVDDVAAMTEITSHVIDRGYARPMFLAGPQTYSAHLLRKETFVAQWTARVGRAPEVISVETYDPARAFDRVHQVLAPRNGRGLPDVLVCENDALAIGAIDAVRHKLGLRVPEDIAVTGFDDVPLASSPNYRLTTYRQPLTAMANRIVEILNEDREPGNHCDFLGQIVSRDSA
ncbi:LacI family DNA-binding transcriptional regulator [Frigidibacter sp. ROC022]|uniref:LacI family DNA-binding transcriptional regulator n=1 Tax=Frigidibacter sp. ROC022 TaxID=2971796 RepID=UPI00215B76C3|nr:LacI family DNA-binding transcriptional regulator [Frigidibacter sp. ROC022]MCR8726079.1 LacI family transcriptional regulator [Frigidibacter sp. ROC022]